jgi:hypothetical protein
MGANRRRQAALRDRARGRPALRFAGLWENWRDRAGGPAAEWIWTCTIITGRLPAGPALAAPVHGQVAAALLKNMV